MGKICSMPFNHPQTTILFLHFSLLSINAAMILGDSTNPKNFPVSLQSLQSSHHRPARSIADIVNFLFGDDDDDTTTDADNEQQQQQQQHHPDSHRQFNNGPPPPTSPQVAGVLPPWTQAWAPDGPGQYRNFVPIGPTPTAAAGTGPPPPVGQQVVVRTSSQRQFHQPISQQQDNNKGQIRISAAGVRRGSSSTSSIQKIQNGPSNNNFQNVNGDDSLSQTVTILSDFVTSKPRLHSHSHGDEPTPNYKRHPSPSQIRSLDSVSSKKIILNSQSHQGPSNTVAVAHVAGPPYQYQHPHQYQHHDDGREHLVSASQLRPATATATATNGGFKGEGNLNLNGRVKTITIVHLPNSIRVDDDISPYFPKFGLRLNAPATTTTAATITTTSTATPRSTQPPIVFFNNFNNFNSHQQQQRAQTQLSMFRFPDFSTATTRNKQRHGGSSKQGK